MVWKMPFKEFQDGGHLGYQNGMLLALLNLYDTVMPHIKFQLNPTYSLSSEEFQNDSHGGHLGYWNGMTLAILNLHVATNPPTKFWLNSTYGFGDVEHVKS